MVSNTTMYGKAFASMYCGSLFGKGVVVFAVWNYCIANMRPNRELKRMEVNLNADLLAAVLGQVKPSEIQAAIQFLLSPDPASQSKAEGGRRLLQIGQFEYVVVNGWHYTQIRGVESRRESNRLAQSRWRQKQRSQAIGKVAQLGGRVAGIPEEPAV